MRVSGEALEEQYSKALRELAELPGLLNVIFDKAQNKITDPTKLKDTAGSLHCGTLLLPKLVKKDGTVEPFDAEKLLAGHVASLPLPGQNGACSGTGPAPDAA